jgi:matrix metalloproteinase-14 (membrane-inserted)
VFAGLPPTGDLDSETVELMNTPRCGVKDKIGHGSRAKRYTLQGSRWKTKELTYRITKYPSSDHLSKQQIDDEISEAFKLWGDSSGLSFKQLDDGNMHIEIRFEKCWLS